MELAILGIVVFLLVVGGSVMWRPENRTWANVAIAVFALGLVLFSAMGACSVVTVTDLQRSDPYGFMPIVVVVGLGSIGGFIGCWIGIKRNRK